MEVKRKMLYKSWKSCCVPKEEGGFNIKEILSWNKALLLKWMWQIQENIGGVWVAWIQTYCLYRVRDVWQLSAKDCHSESWKGILKTRDNVVEQAGGLKALQSMMSKWVIVVSLMSLLPTRV